MEGVLTWLDVGRRPYDPVTALQERLVAARKGGAIGDTLIYVEHEPVYTLGRQAATDHILASREELERSGIQVVRTGRGGDVTYHGPGQLVGYPIVDLGQSGRGPVWYVGRLEQTLIDTLAAFGIAAATDPINRGVWVGRNKIAAIGVRITRQISMHGFALNVTTDLSPYAGIVPCGIRGRGVTSMQRERGQADMAAVKARLLVCLAANLGYARVVAGDDPFADGAARGSGTA